MIGSARRVRLVRWTEIEHEAEALGFIATVGTFYVMVEMPQFYFGAIALMGAFGSAWFTLRCLRSDDWGVRFGLGIISFGWATSLLWKYLKY